MLWAMMLVCGGPGTVLAQDIGDIDAHGAVPPPSTGDPSDPMFGWRARAHVPGAWSAGGLVEYIDDPLVRYEITTEGEQQVVPLLDTVVALNAGGTYTATRRVGVGVGLPLFLFSTGDEGGGGPTLGDMHLSVPVSLIAPTDDGLGLGVVPRLSLPTGAGARFLGHRGPTLGVLGAGSLRFGPVGLGGNLGLDARSVQRFANQAIGGVSFEASLDAHYLLSESLAVHLEGRGSAAFNPDSVVQTGADPGEGGETQASGSPAEVLLTVRGILGERTGPWWWSGAGRGVSSGVGAARLRAMAGGGWRYEPGGDAVVPYTITVTDPAGRPVAGARLISGDKEIGRTNASGVYQTEQLRFRKGIQVSAPSHGVMTLTEPTDPEKRNFTVELTWTPVEVRADVRDQQGAPVDAGLRAIRAVEEETGEVVEADNGALRLEPGSWGVEITADGQGTQTRSLDVRPGMPPVTLDVVMLPDAGAPASIALQIDDLEGAGVDNARVLLDGKPLGATANGGLIEVAALSAGPHTLEIVADTFTQVEERVELVEGANDVGVVLERLPGTVKVVVRGPEGQIVTDATARFDGPARLPITPMGASGARYFGPLRPGDWRLSVISPEYGVQVRDIEIPPDAWELIVVEVVLRPDEQGEADLTVRLIDPLGRPIPEARIALDGKDYGTTSTGGTLQMTGLLEGPRTLTVQADNLREVPALDLLLAEGPQEKLVAMDWKAGATEVITRTPDGPVRDAVVRFAGPATRSIPLGPGGEGFFLLESGEWLLLVTSAEHGLAQRDLVVGENSRILHRVDIVMGGDESGAGELALTVTDPDGQPVGGAAVALDGSPLGATTPDGRVRLGDLSAGDRELTIAAPTFAPFVETLKLGEGRIDKAVQLQWAPGAVKVITRSAAGPVTDAIVRFVGPQTVQPAPVDSRGQRLFALPPGTWQALVVSPDFGIASRSVEIAEDTDGLTTVDVEMVPVEAGTSTLLVRVQDLDGKPVSGAEVQLGKRQVVTGDGGVAVIEGLPPGRMALGVSATWFLTPEPTRVDLREGSQERIVQLGWQTGQVRVVVTDASGAPVDADVHFDGPADRASGVTGPDGEEVFALRPGAWGIVASTSELGPKRGEVVVTSGDEVATVALQLEATRVSFTRERVELKEKVPFQLNEATLLPEAKPILDEVANTLIAHTEIIKVEVQGHADASGEAAYNLRLSQDRAEAVVRALVERGVPPELLNARGYGLTKPIADNTTAEGRAKNRRVQFDIQEQSETE